MNKAKIEILHTLMSTAIKPGLNPKSRHVSIVKAKSQTRPLPCGPTVIREIKPIA
jgi:hypothetical protein